MTEGVDSQASDSAVVTRVKSPWSWRLKVARQLWYVAEASLFRFSPRVCYRFRVWLLRLFGAQVDWSARIRGSVTIECPWNLTIGHSVIVGDRVILYALGPIVLDDLVMVSQGCHLCSGTHDERYQSLPLVLGHIVIGKNCWIAADVFVGPRAVVGERTVVGARSGVFGDLPAGKVCVGQPARPVRERVFLDDSELLP